MAIFSSYVSLPEGKPTQVLQGLLSQNEPSSMDHQTLTLAPALVMIGHGSLQNCEPVNQDDISYFFFYTGKSYQNDLKWQWYIW